MFHDDSLQNTRGFSATQRMKFEFMGNPDCRCCCLRAKREKPTPKHQNFMRRSPKCSSPKQKNCLHSLNPNSDKTYNPKSSILIPYITLCPKFETRHPEAPASRHDHRPVPPNAATVQEDVGELARSAYHVFSESVHVPCTLQVFSPLVSSIVFRGYRPQSSSSVVLELKEWHSERHP